MTVAPFSEAVALVRAGVDRLLSADLGGLEKEELVAAFDAVETQKRRLEAVDARLLARAHETSLAASCGQAGMAGLLAARLRLDGPVARRRVERADRVGPRRALTGEPLLPALPVLAEAVEQGAVSVEQVDVIVDAARRLPPGAPVQAVEVVEWVLVAAAEEQPPRVLRQTAAELLARLDPEGSEPVEEQIRRRRGFGLVRHPDGSATARGLLDAETAAHWLVILDALSAPRTSSKNGDETASDGAGADAVPDTRTAAQRRHDALLEVARLVLRSGELPAAGGVPVTVLATISMADLARAAGHTPPTAPAARTPSPLLDLDGVEGVDRAGLAGLLARSSGGLARLGHGQSISAKLLLAMACDAELIPVVFNDTGGVLAYGRGRRLASRGQRLALAARDGGCCFPGCDRPPAWTEVHHVTPWISGGTTDIDQMCLLCSFHHRHFADAGWQVRLTGGVPVWTPPPWYDPQQRPRRNTSHHPEIVFRQPRTA